MLTLQESYDGAEIEQRLDEFRSSRYFPAIVGAAAGGLAGVGMMLLVGRLRSRSQEPNAYDEEGNPVNVVYVPKPAPAFFGFSPRELITLFTLGLSLLQQLRSMQEERPSS